MNEVLGTTAGNAVEVREAIAYLAGEGGPGGREPRQHEVTMALSAELLVIGGLFAGVADARAACERALASGEAARAVRAHGRRPRRAGRPAGAARTHYLPLPEVTLPVFAGPRRVHRRGGRSGDRPGDRRHGRRAVARRPGDRPRGRASRGSRPSAPRSGPTARSASSTRGTVAQAEAAAAEFRAAVTIADAPPAAGAGRAGADRGVARSRTGRRRRCAARGPSADLQERQRRLRRT